MTCFVERHREYRRYSSSLRLPRQIILIACFCLLYSGCTIRNVSRAPEPPFPMLDQYGQWFVLQPYGDVWQPTVALNWRPFAAGRWLWTDRGWYWDSPEPYGWVVYHYGYWVFSGASGWVWVPGYDWSPARVQWFVSDRYVGWAPMIPGHPAPSPSHDPAALWIVVPTRTFTFDNVAEYHVRSLPSLRSAEGGAPQRPPDVGLIEQHAARPVPQLRTETQKVPSGGKSLTQVRITGEQTRGGAGELPPPPASGGKNPPPARTRESGQTRTPPPGEVPQETPAQPDTTKSESRPSRQREERKPG